MTIILNSVDRIREFNSRIQNIKGDCDLRSGNYVVDAKSIMGIFGLDVSRPLELVVHDDSTDLQDFKEYEI